MKKRKVKHIRLKNGEATLNIRGSVKTSADTDIDKVDLEYEPGEGVVVKWDHVVKGKTVFYEEMVPMSVLQNIKFYAEDAVK